MKNKRPGDKTIAALLFFLVLVLHASSANVTSTDSARAIQTAMSLVQQGNTDLDEYRDLIPARGLLIYSPILIFSDWGLRLNLRRSSYHGLILPCWPL